MKIQKMKISIFIIISYYTNLYILIEQRQIITPKAVFDLNHKKNHNLSPKSYFFFGLFQIINQLILELIDCLLL